MSTQQLEEIQAENRALLRRAMVPIFSSILESPESEVDGIPVAMLLPFLSMETYRSLMYAYHEGLLELLRLHEAGEVPHDSDLYETARFMHWAQLQDSYDRLEPKVDPRCSMLLKLKDSTVGSSWDGSAVQRSNATLWNDHCGRINVFKHIPGLPFHGDEFRYKHGREVVNLFHDLDVSLRDQKNNQWDGETVITSIAMGPFKDFWETVVFMLLFATDKVDQVSKYKLSKKHIAYYTDYANHLVKLIKLGANKPVMV
jgi:hypothetical protein